MSTPNVDHDSSNDWSDHDGSHEANHDGSNQDESDQDNSESSHDDSNESDHVSSDGEARDAESETMPPIISFESHALPLGPDSPYDMASGEDDLDPSDSEAEEDHGFFDLEASESQSQSESETLKGEDDDDEQTELFSFPQFCRLPPELRRLIWDMFDPDMRAKARVFDFRLILTGQGAALWESATLEQQTAPARAILATHRESRNLALASYPDTMHFAHGSIPFHAEKDVIVCDLSRNEPRCPQTDEWLLPGWLPPDDLGNLFPAKIKHLGIKFTELISDVAYTFDHRHYLTHMLRLAPNRTYYHVEPADAIEGEFLRPFVSDKFHAFHVETFEQEPGLGEDIEYTYCWPNLLEHEEFARDEMARNELVGNPPAVGRCSSGKDGWGKIWPMIVFEFDSGRRRFEKIKAADAREGPWEDNYSGTDRSDDEFDDSDNEYESDGINDDTLDEEESSDDGDHVVYAPDNESAASEFNGLSPMRGPIDGAANFSSPEPDSPGTDARNGDDSDLEPGIKTKRSKRRFVASDSEDNDTGSGDGRESSPKRRRVALPDPEDDGEDDGEDGDDNVEVERPRPLKRRRRVVESDSESDDDDGQAEQPRPPKRRGRMVLSDSEDGEEDDAEGGRKRGVRGKSLESEEDEEESSADESEDSEPATLPKQSLFERLELFRSANPVVGDGDGNDLDGAQDDQYADDSADDDDDELETEGGRVGGGGDYETVNYADFQDDEDGGSFGGSEDGEGYGVVDELGDDDAEEEW